MGVHVRGSFHQGDTRFEGRGRQCTAMAMRAVAHDGVKDVSLWTTQDVDAILDDGDRLYLSAADAHDVTLLLPSEAVQSVMVNGLKVNLRVDNTRNGTLDCRNVSLQEGTVTLQHALQQIEHTAVFTVGGVFSSYTISIMNMSSVFYVFDSHSRDEAGMCHPDGLACVTRHEGLDNLISFLHDLCQSLGMSSDTLFEVVNVYAYVEMTEVNVGQERCVNDCNLEFSVDDDIPLSNLTEGKEDTDDDIPLSHLRQDEDDLPLSHLRHRHRQIDDESDSNVPLSTFKPSLSPDGIESEVSSDHDDSDEYIPSKEEMKDIECSSSEMSCDDDHDDEHVRPEFTAGLIASSENQPQMTDSEQVTSEQTNCDNVDDCLNASVDSRISTGSTIADLSQTASPCPFPTQQDQPRQSRKRVRNEDDWKINQRKRLRNSGQSYVSRTGKSQRKREMKSGCGDQCRNKCRSKISDDERVQIFHSYWKLGCLTQQRQYLCKTVKKTEKKSALTKSCSRRSSSYEYYLHINEKTVKVCKKMFLGTLDISDTVVATSLTKMNCLGTCDPETRGKQSKRGNSKDTEKQEIRQHINSFPRMESHYARKDSMREYLESSLSLLKMYDMYVEKRKNEGCQTPASETTYRNVFNREFNISFQKRMKDRCDVCAGYENRSSKQTEDEDYIKHIQMKEESRKLKNEVKASLKDEPSLAAAVFDLEEVLSTPSSVESCLYYKRKLNTFNLTVYDYRNGQGYCNVWSETTALRGSNEIASCVYRYLERISKDDIKKVILFSDSCGGQNRNKNFLTMLWYALSKFQFEEIQHIFFVSGHSQNEGDSMHSVIERSSRHIPVYTPSQWAQVMRAAKRHAPLYIVEELVQSDFFDFKKVAGLLKNFQLDTQKEKIRWLNVKRFKLSSQEPNVVHVGYDYTGDYCQLNLVQKLRTVHNVPDPTAIDLENVSKTPYPITKEKYDDLISLCERDIIPKAHHHYFLSLPHSGGDVSLA